MCNAMRLIDRQTPLPYVFCVHLKQCVSAYLFALPFTLVDAMGWRMVPVVTVVAFTLMGVEGIASEIEQPFGTYVHEMTPLIVATPTTSISICTALSFVARLSRLGHG